MTAPIRRSPGISRSILSMMKAADGPQTSAVSFEAPLPGPMQMAAARTAPRHGLRSDRRAGGAAPGGRSSNRCRLRRAHRRTAACGRRSRRAGRHGFQASLRSQSNWASSSASSMPISRLFEADQPPVAMVLHPVVRADQATPALQPLGIDRLVGARQMADIVIAGHDQHRHRDLAHQVHRKGDVLILVGAVDA